MPPPSAWLGTLATSAALIAAPLGLGAVAGAALRRLRGRRFCGPVPAVALSCTPAAIAFGLVVRFPIVGLWDAALEGLLFGVGLVGSAHRALGERKQITWAASTLVASLVLLELLCRLVLPPPPYFPVGIGPHLWLADALRGDARHQPWDTLSKDIVCSTVYGSRYPPIFGAGAARSDIVTPRNFSPRAGARRRVLHLGDSMAFGFGLERNQSFTAVLERIEPDVQHINASIPGTAPDGYFAVLGSWLAAHPIDTVVMHVFEANDLDGLDARHPCCGWRSLLAYGAAGVALRCRTPTAPELDRAGFAWLRYHSPPPYLVRALVGVSSAAAYSGQAMTMEPYFLADQSMTTQLAHLEAIVRSTRDMLAARQIAFVIVVLPARTWLEELAVDQRHAPEIVAVARRNHVSVLDPSDLLRQAILRGEPMFPVGRDIHYTAEAHALLAAWLHRQLGGVDRSPQR